MTAARSPIRSFSWTRAALPFALALAAGAASYWGSRGLDETLTTGAAMDRWFDADCPRVFENLTDPRSVQSRSAVHPLFTLFLYPAVASLRALGAEPIVAVRVVRAATAGACMAVFFGLLRTLGCRRLDAVVFCALAALSAAAVCWFVVPETYPPGLLAILLALWLVARGPRGRYDMVWDVAVNVATLGFTLTNWVAGIVAALFRWRCRRAMWIVLGAAYVAWLLLVVQNQVFPSAVLLPISREEPRYVLHPGAGGPGRVACAFFLHAVVLPDVRSVMRDDVAILSVQRSWPGTSGPWGLAATLLWVMLLSLGAYSAWRCRVADRFSAALGLTVAAQFLLHLVYGPETFTYACHYGPPLVAVAALASLSPLRRAARYVAVALCVCVGVNNVQQSVRARGMVQALCSQPELAAAIDHAVAWRKVAWAAQRAADPRPSWDDFARRAGASGGSSQGGPCGSLSERTPVQCLINTWSYPSCERERADRVERVTNRSLTVAARSRDARLSTRQYARCSTTSDKNRLRLPRRLGDNSRARA